MRRRFTATMKKQLADVRDRKVAQRKGGVMRVPRILSCDEWEAIAAPMQDKLIEDSYEDRYKPEAVVIHDDTAARNAAENERLYQQSRKNAADGACHWCASRNGAAGGTVVSASRSDLALF